MNTPELEIEKLEIEKDGDTRWYARIYVRDQRPSGSFKSYDAAMKWATNTMADLAARDITQYTWNGEAWVPVS